LFPASGGVLGDAAQLIWFRSAVRVHPKLVKAELIPNVPVPAHEAKFAKVLTSVFVPVGPSVPITLSF
jgi:hypothetical protein